MGYSILFSGVTHIGRCRVENQDNMVCNSRIVMKNTKPSNFVCGTANVRNNAVFGVFDGMGSTQCGEVAAMIAALNAENVSPKNDIQDTFFDYCIKTNNEICACAKANNLTNMGTTAAILAFGPQEISLCNIGDTKIFRISKNELEQISSDHAVQLPNGKRYLTQDLGTNNDPTSLSPYIAHGQYKNGDHYLICSDGLTDMVGENEIMRIIKGNRLEDTVPMLLNAALMQGGKDNITIILCKVLHRLFR